MRSETKALIWSEMSYLKLLFLSCVKPNQLSEAKFLIWIKFVVWFKANLYNLNEKIAIWSNIWSYIFLSLATFSIWTCRFVMYEAYFCAISNENPLSEMFYLSKIVFWEHIFWPLKRNSLTKEIGKRTVKIHHIMALKMDEYIKHNNVCKSYCLI